jgi:DNA integrity scanning protein DisA with diadenylate cyclase activity
MPFDLSIISLKDILDILLVAFILYKTYKVMKSSGSINIFIGILVFIIIWIIVSQVLQMRLLGSIFDKLVSNNLTFDCFASLHKKYGDDIHLLFDCSTRDGDLAKVQNYFDDGIMDVDEKQADEFQQILKEAIPEFKEAGVSLFIWDGVPWYDDLRNMTAHTIIATPAVWIPFEDQKNLLQNG